MRIRIGRVVEKYMFSTWLTVQSGLRQKPIVFIFWKSDISPPYGNWI